VTQGLSDAAAQVTRKDLTPKSKSDSMDILLVDMTPEAHRSKLKNLVSDGKAKNYYIRKIAKSAINYIYSDKALPQLTTESCPTSCRRTSPHGFLDPIFLRPLFPAFAADLPKKGQKNKIKKGKQLICCTQNFIE
jgi:hypothetical protein